MLGFSLKLPSGSLRARLSGAPPVPTPTPTPTSIDVLVIEGDSITFAGGSNNNGFAWQYAAAPPSGKTATVRSENSRVVSVDHALNDGGNSLISRVDEDVTAYGAQLIATMIGANDMAVARTAAQYRADLIGLYAEYRARGVKFAWSAPLPYGSNQAHGSYANFMAQRAAVLATCRDPAVWGLFADYYVPLGEHPDFSLPDNMTLIGSDGVHPTQTGQDAMLPVFRAAIDTLLDASRATSTSMTGAAWPASETNLAASTQIVRRFVVRGIAHAGLASGAGVSGGGAALRLNGGGWGTAIGTGSGDGHRLYNGDTIDLRLTTSGSAATATDVVLRVGDETRALTFRTVASVTPAAYVHGDVEGSTQMGPVHVYAARDFAAGVAVIGVNWTSDVTGVKVGGVAATRRVHQIGGHGAIMLDVWTAPVTAGTRDIEVTTTGIAAGQDSVSAIGWGVVTGADPVPTAMVADSAAATTDLATPAITIPAAGLAIGLFGEYAGGSSVAGATVSAGNGGTAAIDEGQVAYNGEVKGLAIARRTATGAMSWDFAGAGYGPHPRAALAFKAAGT